MPWFPEFFSAVELARNQTRATGLADPVGQYFTALKNGDTHALENVWPGEVVVFDPRAGEIRGHHKLRRFVHQNRDWLAERHATTETVTATRVSGRAVVELLVQLEDGEGRPAVWPVAVVAESFDDLSVVFRTYCSQWPVDGRRHLRSAILTSGHVDLPDVVGRYQAALVTGDVDAVMNTFAPDGYFREPMGTTPPHRGTADLREFFASQLRAGGIGLEIHRATDDGTRCALEYNYVRWGSRDLPTQAGLGVYERGPDGLLAAVRVYDDVEPPFPDE